jgi:hypothetical protein
MVLDKICFNGEPDNKFCTDADKPFEFFVITDLPTTNPLFQNSLFSGILGLSTNTTSRIKGVTQ